MSAYNVRVVRYNRFTQFRIYDKPIIKNENEENEDDNKTYFEENNKNNEKDSKKDAERSNEVSINRTVQTIYEYALNNEWKWFVTLTFDNEKIDDRTDYKLCTKKFKKWIDNIKQRSCKDIMYLCVPELHKKGGVHFHVLMNNCDNLQFVDSERVAIGKKAYKRTDSNAHYPTIYNLANWKYGFSTATIIQDSVKCSNYITKYISKELCVHVKNMSRFYKSANLKKCEHEYLNLPIDVIDDIIKTVDIEYAKTQEIPFIGQKIKYITVKGEYSFE